ncbi:hypothetical protein RSJ9_3368 [Clostridium botulinum]|nr:hypothetical protein RSJ9_3368 [Clostridium botulinum]
MDINKADIYNKKIIEELAKEMTRKEFLDEFVSETTSCPSYYGLKKFDNTICNAPINCKECYDFATKDIKFKGENEIKVTKDKIKKHEEIYEKLNEIYKTKNHDYGDSFGETYSKLGIISAVTRITDKVNRLQSLCTKDALVDESIKDTLIDLANYSIMTLIELEGEE